VPDRYDQRICDQGRCHISFHRPANHAAREEINDSRDIEQALQRPDIGKISHPLLIGKRRRKLPIDYIDGDEGLSITQIFDSPRRLIRERSALARMIRSILCKPQKTLPQAHPTKPDERYRCEPSR
jgi:hypothetical protein